MNIQMDDEEYTLTQMDYAGSPYRGKCTFEKGRSGHFDNTKITFKADFSLLMDSRIIELEKSGSSMSAELSYKDRLIKAYEEEITPAKQKEIKRFIFSEDDR